MPAWHPCLHAPSRRASQDPGLFAQIVVAAVVTPSIVLAGLALIVAVASLKVIGFVTVASVVGVVAAVKERHRQAGGVELTKNEAPRIHALTERLCLLADLPKPRLMLEHESQPNSWVAGTRAGGYSLHLTSGLVQTLDKHELEAVIAHELAHVANRDAGATHPSLQARIARLEKLEHALQHR
jgi:heat shock protein HtpX